MCWDKFDMNEDRPSGSGTTHTSHGIIIQEKSDTSSIIMDKQERKQNERP